MQREIVDILTGHGASFIAIFGSRARGEGGEDSDLDVLVRFSEKKSLMDIVRIERELSENIGIKVDLVTEKALSPYIREGVESDMEVIMA